MRKPVLTFVTLYCAVFLWLAAPFVMSPDLATTPAFKDMQKHSHHNVILARADF